MARKKQQRLVKVDGGKATPRSTDDDKANKLTSKPKTESKSKVASTTEEKK